RFTNDLTDRSGIIVVNSPAQPVCEEFFSDRRNKKVRMAEQCLLESCRTVKLNAVGEITRSIDGGIPIAGSPTAHGIIVLQGETNWIHKLMTTRTGRVRSMLRHPFPHCKNFAI